MIFFIFSYVASSVQVQLKSVFHQVRSMLDVVLILQCSNSLLLRQWNWSNTPPLHQAVCKYNCAWRANALEYFADLLANTISSFGIPFVSSHLLRHAHLLTTVPPSMACTWKGEFDFREKHAVFKKYTWHLRYLSIYSGDKTKSSFV